MISQTPYFDLRLSHLLRRHETFSSSKMNYPTIKGPDHHDFHDSSLIDFIVAPGLDRISVVISTPDENHVGHLWLIEFDEVLALEYESLGIRSMQKQEAPVEIYDIYNDYLSEERKRWVERFRVLGESEEKANCVHHIVLASSSMRGWGEREKIEGINILCRNFQIRPAPAKYEASLLQSR